MHLIHSSPQLYAGLGGDARRLRLQDGRAVTLRAARPGDVPAVQKFVRELSEVSRLNRFFAPVRELTPAQLDRVTRARDPRELALVDEAFDGGESRIVGLAQHALCEPPNAEFALVVGDDYQRQGIGTRLIGVLTEHAADAGVAALVGFVRYDNWPMLTLLARLGFEFLNNEEPQVIRVAKPLDAQGLAA
jgi:acetyltransferase